MASVKNTLSCKRIGCNEPRHKTYTMCLEHYSEWKEIERQRYQASLYRAAQHAQRIQMEQEVHDVDFSE